MNTTLTAGLAGLALLAAASSATADPYFGGASGRATLDGFAPRSGTFVDADATSEKYFFGIELGHHFKLEVDKVNFGDFEGPAGPLEFEGTSYSALFESGIGRGAHAFLRFGRFNWDGTDFGAVTPTPEHGNDGLWGVGITYRLARGVLLRGEWERYDLGPYKIDMPSLGLVIEL
jgi:hypothetical protein